MSTTDGRLDQPQRPQTATAIALAILVAQSLAGCFEVKDDIELRPIRVDGVVVGLRALVTADPRRKAELHDVFLRVSARDVAFDLRPADFPDCVGMPTNGALSLLATDGSVPPEARVRVEGRRGGCSGELFGEATWPNGLGSTAPQGVDPSTMDSSLEDAGHE